MSRSRIARLESTGALDTGFVPSPSFVGTPVFSLYLQDTKVFAGGTFTGPGNQLARFLSTGAADTSFSTGIGATIAPAASISSIASVNALTAQGDGKFYVGGTFNHYDGQPRSCLARLWNSNYKFTSSTITAGGHVTLTGVGVPGALNHVEAAPAITGPWTEIATVAVDGMGNYLFEEDVNLALNPTRFYRMTVTAAAPARRGRRETIASGTIQTKTASRPSQRKSSGRK